MSEKTLNRSKIVDFILDHIIELLLVVLIIALWLGKDGFMTMGNWLNIFRSVALKGVIAFGMTMIIIAGQIDLSIGSMVALSGVIVAVCCRDFADAGMNRSLACVLGILIALAAAGAFGFIHGYAQHKFNMPSFIITLATQNIIYGLSGLLCGGFPVANQFPEWFNVLGSGRLWGIPVPAIILLIIFAIIYFVMNYTTTGRSVYAVGGNPESARLSGINVMKTKIVVFVVVQVMCVIGGFMNSAQVLAGSFSFGRGWEVDVISSVVIGGTSMLGGIGKTWGTLMGIIFLGVILNGMTLLDLSVYVQYVIKGMLMFFAVLVTTYQSRSRSHA